MLDWFPVCGNHEYRGNTQAFMDYGKVSRRWMMPAKYYTKVFDHKELPSVSSSSTPHLLSILSQGVRKIS